MRFSVIIPVYNDAEALKLLVPALLNQDFDHTQYEILVVDNCSDQNIEAVIAEYPAITFIKECEHPGSPYSCRNRGIEQSSGKIIALLDATCIPVKNWLDEVSGIFESQTADMVAGEVYFRFKKDQPTAAELLDSVNNIRMRESVEQKNVAKTANLFIRRELFDKIGLFEEGLRSGGDVGWTRNATEQGYKLVFSEKAEVRKEARTFFPLMYKQFRVGKGKAKLDNRRNLLKSFLVIFFPIIPGSYRQILRKKNVNTDMFWRLYIVANLMRSAQRAGTFMGLIKRTFLK